jgi:hypothetical protein
LNIGLTAVNNKIQGKQNALQQETSILTEKQDQIRKDLADAGKPVGGGFPVWGWVVLGLAVVGGIVYAVTRKREYGNKNYPWTWRTSLISISFAEKEERHRIV